MAITEAQVHAAAARLDAEGKKVTVLGVRDALGSGSYSTIQKYLATYEGEPVADVTDIPADLLPIFRGIWGRAVQFAQEQARVSVVQAQAQREAMREERDQLVQAMDQQEATLDDLRTALAQSETDRQRLFALLEALRDPTPATSAPSASAARAKPKRGQSKPQEPQAET